MREIISIHLKYPHVMDLQETVRNHHLIWSLVLDIGMLNSQSVSVLIHLLFYCKTATGYKKRKKLINFNLINCFFVHEIIDLTAMITTAGCMICSGPQTSFEPGTKETDW